MSVAITPKHSDKLEKALGYQFQDKALLRQALTHSSVRKTEYPHNERLEFLGDAVLGLVLAAAVFARHPQAQEGQLTRLRSLLARGTMLVNLANELEVGAYLHLGAGELKMEGRKRESTLANAVEALLGAIYLDGGLQPAQACILHLYKGRLQHFSDQGTIRADPKSQLQEVLQQQAKALPLYTLLSRVGSSPDEIFTSECQLVEFGLSTQASGSTRKRAEQAAAQRALEALEQKHGIR